MLLDLPVLNLKGALLLYLFNKNMATHVNNSAAFTSCNCFLKSIMLYLFAGLKVPYFVTCFHVVILFGYTSPYFIKAPLVQSQNSLILQDKFVVHISSYFLSVIGPIVMLSYTYDANYNNDAH